MVISPAAPYVVVYPASWWAASSSFERSVEAGHLLDPVRDDGLSPAGGGDPLHGLVARVRPEHPAARDGEVARPALSLVSIRERRAFWRSGPGWVLAAALAADALVTGP